MSAINTRGEPIHGIATTAAGTAVNDFTIFDQFLRGIDIASAASITLPGPEDYFHLTGTTAVDFIATSYTGPVPLLTGRKFWFYCTGAAVLHHNTGGPGAGFVPLLLSTGADKALAAGTAIQFVYDAALAAMVELGNAGVTSGGGGTVTSVNQGPGIRITGTTSVTVINRLVEGLAGGQTVIGGTAAAETLTLLGSAHVANGQVLVPGAAAIVAFKVAAGVSQFVSSAVVGTSAGNNGVAFVPSATGAAVWDASTASTTEMLRWDFTNAVVVVPTVVTRLEGGLYVTTAGHVAFGSGRQALLVDRSTTLVSGASARFDYFRVDPGGILVTGTTNITGVHVVTNYFTPAVFNGAGVASVAITEASTVEVAGPPQAVAGVSISNAFSFKVNSGRSWLVGPTSVGSVAADPAFIFRVASNNDDADTHQSIFFTPGGCANLGNGTETSFFENNPNETNITAPGGSTVWGARFSHPILQGVSSALLDDGATVYIDGPIALSGVAWRDGDRQFGPWALKVAAGDSYIANLMAGGANDQNPNLIATGTTFGVFGTQSPQLTQVGLSNLVTAGGTTDTVNNWTNLTTYATDAAAIRNAVYQITRKIGQLQVILQQYGLAV